MAAPPGTKQQAKADAKAAAKAAARTAERLILHNRKVRFEFEVLDRVEAGIVLMGSEVKSLREGSVQWGDAHAGERRGELWLYGLHIGEYRQASTFGHQPRQPRKLLLARTQIDRLAGKLKTKGLTIVPERLYFKGPWVKVELCLCRGKEHADKRQSIKARDQQRDLARLLRRR